MSIGNFHKFMFARQILREEVNKMKYRYNVSCSETNSKNWTPTAIDCYSIGCICSRCNIYQIYFKQSKSRCKMKETVIELVRRIGTPKED